MTYIQMTYQTGDDLLDETSRCEVAPSRRFRNSKTHPDKAHVRSNRRRKFNPRKERCVHFEVDRKNEVQHHVIDIEKLTDSKLWWSEEEIKKINRRARDMVKHYASCDSYLNAMDHMLETCATSGADGLDQQKVTRVARSQARGLESHVKPVLQERRQKVIAAILDAQDELENCDILFRERTIASQYSKYCSAVQTLARAMGEADAAQVLDIFENDEELADIAHSNH